MNKDTGNRVKVPVSTETKGEIIIIILFVCTCNWKPLWFFVFLGKKHKVFSGCFPETLTFFQGSRQKTGYLGIRRERYSNEEFPPNVVPTPLTLALPLALGFDPSDEALGSRQRVQLF